MTNAPRHVRPVVASLGPPTLALQAGRPVAAFGRFWYPRPPLWPTAISAAVHVVLGAALVWTTGKAIERRVASIESASFIPPPQREQPPATRGGGGSGMLALVSLSYFSGPGTDGAAIGQGVKTTRRVGRLNEGHDVRATYSDTDTTGAVGDNVYTSFEVDNAVEISYGSTVPEYPPDLLARRVQGKVTVRFVVDTSGSADVESIAILDSSDPQFEASVRAALPRMRFAPARLNGRRVRQLVEQPFRFNVAPSKSNPTDSAT